MTAEHAGNRIAPHPKRPFNSATRGWPRSAAVADWVAELTRGWMGSRKRSGSSAPSFCMSTISRCATGRTAPFSTGAGRVCDLRLGDGAVPVVSRDCRGGCGDAALDLGVHLTLTSEWRHYRWRPLSTVSRASGLIDDDGYFWRDVASLRAHLVPEAAEAELRAQIELAVASGMAPTHIDAHMAAAMLPELLDLHVRLGLEYGVVPVLPRGIGWAPESESYAAALADWTRWGCRSSTISGAPAGRGRSDPPALSRGYRGFAAGRHAFRLARDGSRRNRDDRARSRRLAHKGIRAVRQRRGCRMVRR